MCLICDKIAIIFTTYAIGESDNLFNTSLSEMVEIHRIKSNLKKYWLKYIKNLNDGEIIEFLIEDYLKSISDATEGHEFVKKLYKSNKFNILKSIMIENNSAYRKAFNEEHNNTLPENYFDEFNSINLNIPDKWCNIYSIKNYNIYAYYTGTNRTPLIKSNSNTPILAESIYNDIRIIDPSILETNKIIFVLHESQERIADKNSFKNTFCDRTGLKNENIFIKEFTHDTGDQINDLIYGDYDNPEKLHNQLNKIKIEIFKLVTGEYRNLKKIAF
jgi:hypothetical protein